MSTLNDLDGVSNDGGPIPTSFFLNADGVWTGAALGPDELPHDEPVLLRHPHVEGLPYRIETMDGRVFSGRLGPDGLLPRIETFGEDEYTVLLATMPWTSSSRTRCMGSALVQKARVRTNTNKDSVCSVQVRAAEFVVLWASYPSAYPFVNPKTGKPPPGYENQCAIKVSVAIHGIGVQMKSFRGAAEKVNGLPVALLASQLAAWLKLQPFCGLPKAPENVAGDNWQAKIRGRTGIVHFADYWARNESERAIDKPTGDHVDLWNRSRLTATGRSFFSTLGRRLGIGSVGGGRAWGYSDLGRSSEILFWEIQ